MDPVPSRSIPRLGKLRAFDAVATAGTMGAASGLLHVTQPAITRAVQALEHQLGVPLVARGRRGSFLTEQGVVLGRRTRLLFLQRNAALQEPAGIEPAAADRLARKVSDTHLRCLLAIAAMRSFRGAAQALGVAEPTLHRPARDLERLVKAPLFRRTLDGIGLSPRGAELARRFSLCLVEVSAAIEELAARRGAAPTTLTMGVLPLAPKRLPALATERILRQHPDSRLVIREGGYGELVAALRSGAIDLIFGALRTPPPFDDLDEERLFEDPYRVVCRRRHPLTRVPRLTIADLKPYDWVFAPTDLPRRDVLDTFIATRGLSERVQVETNSLGTLVADLAASDRISLLSREYTMSDGLSDLLAVLDVRVPHPLRVIGLTTRHDWLPTGFQSGFLALMRQMGRESGGTSSLASVTLNT